MNKHGANKQNAIIDRRVQNYPTRKSVLRVGFALSLAIFLLSFLTLALGVPVKALDKIQISKTVSAGQVQAGERFTYTISVKNNDVTSVLIDVITDVIPAGATVVNWGTGTVANNAIVWNSGIGILSGQTITRSFAVTVSTAGDVVNNDYQAKSSALIVSGLPVTTTVLPGPPAQVTVQANPNPVSVEATSVLTVALADSFGNAVTNTTTITITANKGYIAGQPAGTDIVTDTVNGYVVTAITDTVIGTARITATAGGYASALNVEFQAGAPFSMTVGLSGNTITANNADTAAITATVFDKNNNRVPGQSINFATNLGSLSADSATDTNGQAFASLKGTVAGTADITITAASVTSVTQVALMAGSPDHLLISANPTALTADNVSTSAIVLDIEDFYNNPVDQPVAITLTTDLGTFDGGGQTYSATPSNGQVQIGLHAGTQTGVARVLAQTAPSLGLQTYVDVPFNPGPADHVSLVINPAQLFANGSTTALITATIDDFYDNPINTAKTVNFAASEGTLSTNLVNTGNGVATTTLQSTLNITTSIVTATVSGLAPTTGTVDFVVGDPTGVTINTLPAATAPITVGVPVVLTATVTDAVGHVVPFVPITITSFYGRILPANSDNTNSGGTLTRTLVVTRAEADSVEVYNQQGTYLGSKAITFKPDAPAQAVLTASHTALFANGASTATITATITDRFGNPVSGYTPAFSTDAGTIAGNGSTDANGVATAVLTSTTTLETATVTITGLTTVTTVAVDFVAGDPSLAALRVIPNAVTAGDYVTMYITVTDSIGHAIANRVYPVTQTVALNPGWQGQFTCGASDSNGMLTCASQILTQSLHPTVTVNGIVAVGDVITVTPAALDHIALTPMSHSTLSPVVVQSGIPFTFTAEPVDQFGNVRNDSVSWGTPVSFDGSATGSMSNGVFTGQRAGLMLLNVSSGSKTEFTFVQIDPGLPNQAFIQVDPNTVPADNGSKANITVQVLDSSQNPVGAGYNISVSASAGTVEGSGLTDSAGKVYRTIKSGVAGTIVLTATDVARSLDLIPTVGSETSVLFTPGTPDHAIVAVAPYSATYTSWPTADTLQLHANGVDQVVITITVEDALNNAVAADYLIGVSAWPDTLGGGGKTDANGIVTRTLTAPLVEGTAALTLTYGGSPLPIVSGQSDTLEFVVTVLQSLEIAPTGPITVRVNSPTVFTATGFDVARAPIPPSRLTYAWSVSPSGANGDGYLSGSINNSQATFIGTEAGPDPVGLTIVSTDPLPPGGFQFTSIDITVIPGPPVTATLAVSPPSITAGATPITLTLTNLLDQYGNSAIKGEVVTLTIDAQPAPIVLTGVVSGGQVVVTTPPITRAGTFTVSAESMAGAMTLLGQNSVTILPDAAVQAEVLSATPPDIVADGTSSSAVAVQIQDQYGNHLLAGHSPTVTATLGTVSGCGATNATGVVTCTLTADLTLGQSRLWADGFVTTGPTIGFVPGNPYRANLTLGRTSLVAGGTDVGGPNTSAQAVFAVFDEWNHPVADGAVITPSLNPPLGLFTGSMLASSGRVTVTLVSSTTVGVASVESAGLTTLTGDTSVTIVPAPSELVLVRAGTLSSTVSLTQSTALTFTLTDRYGNIVPPTVVTVTASLGTLDATGPTVQKTSAAGTGKFYAAITSTVAGTETFALQTVTSTLSVDPASDNLVFWPDVPQQLTLDNPVSPYTARAGIPFTISVSSRDQFGNPVDPWDQSLLYNWSQTANSPDLPGYGILSSLDPQDRVMQFLPKLVGNNNVTAFGGVGNVTLAVIVQPGIPQQATVSVTPTEALVELPDAFGAPVSTPFTVSIINILDSNGNPINSGVLTGTVDSSPPLALTGTIAGGQVDLPFETNTDAGTHAIVIEGEGNTLTLSGDTSVKFVAGPPYRAYVNATDTQLPADGVSTTALVVTVRDYNFNLVEDNIPITVTAYNQDTGLPVSVTGVGDTVSGQVGRLLTAPNELGTGIFVVSGPDGPLLLSYGSETVDFVVDAPTDAWVQASPSPLVPADGVSHADVQIIIKDHAGHIVTTDQTTVLTVTRGSIVPTTTTPTAGVLNAVFYADNTVGDAGLQVTYDGIPLTIKGDVLKQVSGVPVSATVQASATTLRVDTADQSTLTITLFDDQNRRIVDGSVVTVTTSIGGLVPNAATTVNGAVTRVMTPAFTMGIVGFTFTVQMPWGEAVTLRPTTVPTIQIIPGDLAGIAIAPPGPLSLTAGDSVQLQATGYDAHGNDIGLTTFSWKKWSGYGNGVFSSTMASFVDNIDGPVTLIGTTSGPVGIKAYVGTIYSPMLNVTVQPGVPATATVKANPKIIASGGETSQLVITIRDAYGNLIDNNASVRIVSDLDTLLGDAPVVNGVTTRTLMSGQYYGTANVYVNNFEAGGDKVTIAPRARVTASPGQLIADGTDTAELTIEMLDINGNVITDTANPAITATLGALSGSGGPQNGVLTRTLQASTTVGVSRIYVDGTVAEGSVPMVSGPPAVAVITATPAALPADGLSAASLTIALLDEYGHSLTSTTALTVSASHSQVIGCQAITSWPATCVLTATTTPGLATISVGGLGVTGDAYVHFLDMSGGLLNGGFEAATLTGWATGNTAPPAGSILLPGLYYSSALLPADTVDGINVAPVEGSRMVRLGATTADSTTHEISEAWIRQPVYVPTDTVTQLAFRYRILSYDLAVGSEYNGFQEYDPFEVYIDGVEKFQDGLIYTDEWYYDWYKLSPTMPQDLGWRYKVIDLTGYAGQVVYVEFRMSNRQIPDDNTWLYLDDVFVGPILHADIAIDTPTRLRRPQSVAQVPVLRSDGASTATLTINIRDDFGHVLPTTDPLTVTASHSALLGCAGLINWPATCVLSATGTAGKAVFAVEGLGGMPVSGDAIAYFAGDVRDSDFETASLDNWFMADVVTTTGEAGLPPYTVTIKSSDNIDGIAILPPDGSGMVRLGATDDQNLLYNQPHQTSEVSIWQPIYIPPGTTQLSFWYRYLSYDVAVGSQGEYDPFEVYINGQEVWQAGYEWSAEWQTWYESSPTVPKDMGKQTAYLGLSQYGGQIVTLEFRVSNRRAAVDDTWVYLDELQLTNIPVYTVYLPLVQK